MSFGPLLGPAAMLASEENLVGFVNRTWEYVKSDGLVYRLPNIFLSSLGARKRFMIRASSDLCSGTLVMLNLAALTAAPARPSSTHADVAIHAHSLSQLSRRMPRHARVSISPYMVPFLVLPRA